MKTVKACRVCGTVAVPRKEIQGSFALELALWSLFGVPGMAYTAWRVTTKAFVCPACGVSHLPTTTTATRTTASWWNAVASRMRPSRRASA